MPTPAPTIDNAAARRNMVESQLRPNKVNDAGVIAAMAAVPRELFVPPLAAGNAYLDENLPLSQGRYMMEPMVLARLVQALALQPSDKVLVVGAGSGYGAATIAHLAGDVTALESDGSLARTARGNLLALGCRQAKVVEGPLEAGHAAGAPYDAILIEGAVEFVPDALLRQLGPDGRIATVVRRSGVGKAVLIGAPDGIVAERVLFDAATPLLPGFRTPARFVF
ncbi:MAG TPA: protein-L-isoaspartate O-methyltransferase [Candidatus Cybelea sp.]|nr:protein-L-isoaspartate O-methyltransferase [Candidatus Cybelea sp.]